MITGVLAVTAVFAYRGYAAQIKGEILAEDSAIETKKIADVQNLTAQRIDGTTIKLSWNKVSDCDGYRIYKYDSEKGKYFRIQQVDGASKHSYTISKINANLKKTYRVRAYVKKGKKVYVGKPGTVKTASFAHLEVIGHRGAMERAPENTLASFAVANKRGYYAFECDVRLSTSGNTFFISHDQNLKRMTGHDIDSSKITKKNRKKYPITGGYHVDDYETQYIPTLKETLTYAKGTKMMAYLHIRGELTKAQVKKLVGQIRDCDMDDQVVIFSESQAVVEYFQSYSLTHGFLHRAPTVAKMKAAIDFGKRTKCSVVFLKYYPDLPIPEEVAVYAHKRGIKLAVFTFYEQGQLNKLKKTSGCDYVVVNRKLKN